jgi:hypothetical protein
MHRAFVSRYPDQRPTFGRCDRAGCYSYCSQLGDSGAGTLRQAILDASSSCGDTINFAVSGVITLTSGELPIAKNLTISGPGANVLTVRRSTAGRSFVSFSSATALMSRFPI